MIKERYFFLFLFDHTLVKSETHYVKSLSSTHVLKHSFGWGTRLKSHLDEHRIPSFPKLLDPGSAAEGVGGILRHNEEKAGGDLHQARTKSSNGEDIPLVYLTASL